MYQLFVRLLVFAACIAAVMYADPLLSSLGVPPDPAQRGSGHAVLRSAAWLAGAFATMSVIDVFFWDGFVARVARRPVPRLLKSASATAVLVLAVTGIIGVVLERDVTGIWATSGALGIVLGLALRSTIQDVFTGIFLNVDGSIKPGDWVDLHHANLDDRVYGKVLEISWRTTSVQLENNNVIVVPNSMMGTMAVTNYAHAEHTSRLETEIVIDFDVPPERARRILLAGARAAAGTKGILLHPPPSVIIGQPTDRGIEYEVRFWGKVTEGSPSAMQDAVMTQILKHLRIAGLTPAYPKEDIFFERRPARLLLHEEVADRAQVLSRIALFGKALHAGEIETLAAAVSVNHYEPGHYLVREREAGNSLFVVVEGMVDIEVQRDGDASPVHVNHIGAGEIFGEMSLLTGEPRSASVVARTAVIAYELPREPFESILASRPAIADPMSAVVAEHRMRTTSAVEAQASSDREHETRRLKEQILERMRSVFAVLRGSRPNRSPGQAAG